MAVSSAPGGSLRPRPGLSPWSLAAIGVAAVLATPVAAVVASLVPPAVDVWANGRTVLEDVPNGASATLKVPAGVYAAWVSLPDEYAPVIGPAVLKLARGTAYQVYAWGSAESGYEFAVVSLRVGTR